MKTAVGSRVGFSAVYRAENVDLPLSGGVTIPVGTTALEVRATPGHTDGCLSFVTADHAMVFTGDSLMVRGAGRTDFQKGDADQLFRSIRDQLFTLPDECVLYPGHDYLGRTSSTIGEERRFNPRIGGGARLEDFVGYMHNMALAHPKQMAVAVPANLKCGKPDGAQPAPSPVWGPVVITYAGLPEIAAEWVAAHRQEVRLLDVRSPAELDGELKHIEGAQLISARRVAEGASNEVETD